MNYHYFMLSQEQSITLSRDERYIPLHARMKSLQFMLVLGKSKNVIQHTGARLYDVY